MSATATKAEWRLENGKLQAFLDGTPVVWFPQAGSQEALLRCPIFEALLSGNRGGGKTDCLIMDFAKDVGIGLGDEWRGVLFRRTYPELDDIVNKTQHWFNAIWPKDGPNPANFNIMKMQWTWKSGESLLLRHMSKKKDYLSYHGHAYPWIGWEELTTWANDDCYKVMFSCCRSAHPVVAKKARVRSTTNPYGPGHNWVKKRWRLPMHEGHIVGDVIRDSVNMHGDTEPPRVAIRSSLAENKILLIADPGYLQRIKSAARNEAELKAWVDGSWDITCGGMLDDLWNRNIHIVPDIPYDMLRNAGWFLNRAYDHGQSKPFSVGWWAESNGEPLEIKVTGGTKLIGTVRGDLILFDQWYGNKGDDNKGINMPAMTIADGIKERESDMELKGYIKRGPADSQIFARTDGKTTVAGDMRKRGMYWDDVDKSRGSRKQGWQKIRTLLAGALGHEDTGAREDPGMFICARNLDWIRTVPPLPRSDKDLDDVNTEVEDHDGDMTRYRLRWTRRGISRRKW